jgi:hypothetical protein
VKYFLLFFILLTALVLAHELDLYQSKSFEFHREGHVIDVRLESNNVLNVYMDTVHIGSRTNFCTPK